MSEASDPTVELVDRHLWVGWLALLIFLTLGIGLEALNGFKVGWYLDVSNETRRAMLRLGHAHGALLGLCNIALASTIRSGRLDLARLRLGSTCFTVATVLLPAGFFLGGLVIYGGDPGLGIVLVPIGGLLLLVGAALVVASLRRGSAT